LKCSFDRNKKPQSEDWSFLNSLLLFYNIA
jgi:hypothetical protein